MRGDLAATGGVAGAVLGAAEAADGLQVHVGGAATAAGGVVVGTTGASGVRVGLFIFNIASMCLRSLSMRLFTVTVHVHARLMPETADLV